MAHSILYLSLSAILPGSTVSEADPCPLLHAQSTIRPLLLSSPPAFHGIHVKSFETRPLGLRANQGE